MEEDISLMAVLILPENRCCCPCSALFDPCENTQHFDLRGQICIRFQPYCMVSLTDLSLSQALKMVVDRLLT